MFQIILYIEEFPVVVGPIGGKICPWFQGVVLVGGRGGGVVPPWSVYTTTPSPHLMSYCVSRSSGSRRRGIRLWFSTRWASHFSLHYVTKLMSKGGSLSLIFDRFGRFWKQAIWVPLSPSPKQNFIHKKDLSTTCTCKHLSTLCHWLCLIWIGVVVHILPRTTPLVSPVQVD